MKSNGGMWRMRMRYGKGYHKALRNALEDFQVKTPDQQAKIHNRGAWLTDRFERCLPEIEKPTASISRCDVFSLLYPFGATEMLTTIRHFPSGRMHSCCGAIANDLI
jgi:hypothetical protein